ncbi:hypothetical protein BC939DRAFT_495267 [Gamsiella multidivaricata]|uniref:uncharacterized protein n=1 Tax=Gamsiella multidivaricata TaxID=101098 RepID=UPI002220F983|nr:uncharacterized protein BC939DRAFT_495267 [Gamsiella multidivaricata]KAI7819423.1 hypothetical protein BC939DRAFT_495267 [Gamsiella multidivaricata]
MGIRGLYSTLKKRGLDPVAADPQDYQNQAVEVDLFGAFYGSLVRQITDDYDPSKVRAVGLTMAARLAKDFTPAQCTIHIDGAPSQQKRSEHIRRKNRLTADLKKLQANLKVMSTKSSNGQWTSKSVVTKIKKGLRDVYRFDAAAKQTLRDALREKGFSVCTCRTEADTCIARTLTMAAGSFVVSADSNLLIYLSVTKILRPIFHGLAYALYTKESVTNALHVPSADYVTLLGIVSKNDYTENIPGLGIVRNLEIIRALSQSPDISYMFDAYRFMAAIKTHEVTNQSRFKPSEDIFLDLEEKVLQLQPGDEAADEDMLGFDFNSAAPQFRHLELQRFAVAAYQHASRSAVPFYVARNSKRNQFRSIFSDKKSILPRQSIDFSTVVPHDRPQPKAKPPVKTRKAVLKN